MKGFLTDQERKQLTRLQELDKVDPEQLTKKEASARADINNEINWTYYTSFKFATGLAHASTLEGVKMGGQQAFGLVLVEFFHAIFDEINDWSKNGRGEANILRELKARLLKVAGRCEQKLQSAFSAFGNGFVSGFLSSLVTTLINAFFTTGKRLVRMIREGFLSLLRGVEMLLFPPAGMSFREAAHEASKVLLAGGLMVGAIPVEDWLEKQLLLFPSLPGIADSAAPAIVGALNAVATGFCIYLLDQADLIGVNRDKRLAGTVALLNESIAITEQRITDLLSKYQDYSCADTICHPSLVNRPIMGCSTGCSLKLA